MVHNIDKWNKF